MPVNLCLRRCGYLVTLAAALCLSARIRAAGAPHSTASDESAAQDSCLVSLTAGDVQGLDTGDSCAFLGVPYADSTAGPNRWRRPQARAPWAPQILDVRSQAAGCSSILGTSIFGAEDCLKVNIWVRDPVPATPAPVIVWLHPGAFTNASANLPSSNGRRLAEETGAVIVAPNYRLAAFGFLYHPALAAEDPDGSSGNYGLLDQQAALRWVRENIARFGGDPDNITLAGTSAGGQSVGLQLVSPGAEGLVHRAIVQSAYPTSRWRSAAEAAAQGAQFATALGCTDPLQVLGCLRAKSRDEVLTALAQATQQIAEPPSLTFWEPVVDGVVLPDQPRVLFEQGAFQRIPTIVGFNRDEGWGAFITRSFGTSVSLAQYESWVRTEFGPDAAAILDLYPATDSTAMDSMARLVGDVQFACEARRLARLTERAGAPTYLYSYDYVINDVAANRVIHGVESNILFGNDYIPPLFPTHPLTSADMALHDAMAGYWTRFAATGNPNSDDESIVHWPAFKHPVGGGRGSDKYLIFDSAIVEGLRSTERACDFFEPFFFQSVLSGVPAWK